MSKCIWVMLILAALLGAARGALAAPPGKMSLKQVKHWAYVLQGLEDPKIYRQVVNSAYDLYVLEAVVTEKGLKQFDAAGMVRRIRRHNIETRGVDPLVVAYVNIGQAEAWRWYYEKSWRPGNPDWIAGDDPDGWAGNYPVAFWSPQWRRIMISGHGGMSQLNAVLQAGFDGMFMDWVQVYNDPEVLKLAKKQGVDATKAMFKYLEDMRRYARSRAPKANPGFLMIAQNAPDLFFTDTKRYLGVIDALSAESVWYAGTDGGDDWNHPLGYNVPMAKLDPGVAEIPPQIPG